jgi:dTDP-4-dehydrorhamnose 3,5-epimerase
MNLTVPVGKIRCIFYDKKSNKKSIFNLSEKNFGTLYVPPKIWFAFQNLDKKKNSLLVNFSNIVHDKNETINKDFEEI